MEILNIVPTLDTGVGAASARARAGSSRPGVPGSALKPRAIVIAYIISVLEQRESLNWIVHPLIRIAHPLARPLTPSRREGE